MSKVFPMVPRLKAEAERNLADYILHARERSTVFGRDLDFDQCEWNVTDYYSRRGHRNSKHVSKMNGGLFATNLASLLGHTCA